MTEQFDLHVHTRLSPCGQPEMRLSAIIDRAARTGVKYLGITDHMSDSTDPAILTEVRTELERLEPPMQVFVGCEADILSVGRHVVTDDVRSRVDFIAVAANHFHLSSVEQPHSGSPEAMGKLYLDMFAYACTLEWADVIVHPMTVLLNAFDSGFLDTIRDEDMAGPIETARENGIAIEISPRALVPDQMAFRIHFLSLCKRIGAKFTIGSDAHRLDVVGCGETLSGLVNELGITESDIWAPNKRRCFGN